MSDVPEIIHANGEYWESLAPYRTGASVEQIRAESVVDDRQREVLGDLAGKRVVQLAASVGDEAMQFALMGGDVMALDIAPSHVSTGRANAAELGVAVDFRVADMTDLPADVQDVDVFYISWGGLCWVPDLNSWMGDLAARLRHGGRFVVAEHHPLWEILSTAGEDSLTVNASYFDPTWHKDEDPDKGLEVLKELALTPTGDATSFVWNLGSVVSAFLAAGLTVIHLREYPVPDLYDGFADAAHLPAIYVTAAEKPRREVVGYL